MKSQPKVFARNIAEGMSAQAAYKAAGYEGAGRTAPVNASNPLKET
ncbi:hypothetical protein N9195_02855 [bacterium]|nr:hypothetical protein [bacterium]